MNRTSTLLVLVAIAAGGGVSASAAAGELYKCVAPNGLVTIQSERCPAGSTQVWKREAAPEPPLTAEQMAQAEARRRREAEDALSLARKAGTLPQERNVAAPAPAPAAAPVAAAAPEPAKGPCRRAHELADGIRANAWLEMRDDQLRRLDDWVAKQCSDPEQAQSP